MAISVIERQFAKIPQNMGDYDSGQAYGVKERVNLYGCEWESKIEENTYPPATLVGGVVTPDTDHWRLNAGVPENYGLAAKAYQKPVTGIPLTDLAEDVRKSINVHISGKVFFAFNVNGSVCLHSVYQYESGIEYFGFVILEKGCNLIVAKTPGNYKFATGYLSGGTTYVETLADALQDFDGKTKTATIDTTLNGGGSIQAPAADYCLNYTDTYTDQSITPVKPAGSWWLPSFGELVVIYSHLDEINYMSSLIGVSGGLIPASKHIASSTEAGASYYWDVMTYNARATRPCFATNGKLSSNWVIPVTSL